VTASAKAGALRRRKGGRPIAALTAYDYPTARLLDEAGVDVLLVGDSLGMVVLGMPDTTQVTLEHMLHHIAAVARAAPQALVLGDLPIHTYDTPAQALATARRLVAATARLITSQIAVPTIGIGSGDGSCDGEVAVVTDLLGSFPWFVPPFARPEANVADATREAAAKYVARVTSR